MIQKNINHKQTKKHCSHFEDGWMAENFFTGGTMPSDDLLLYYGQHFSCETHWRVNSTNYEKTSNGWLKYLDTNWKNETWTSFRESIWGWEGI